MADSPTLSLCIATGDRAPFLDQCLSRLGALAAIGFPAEVVVSDDASADETGQVLEHWQAELPFLRVLRQTERVGHAANLTNAVRAARGDLVVCLADGDWVVMQALAAHVARMLEEPDLAAIYTDWVDWDDDAGREIARHFGLTEAASFAPGDPLGLVNFVMQRGLTPDVAVYRRRALLSAWVFEARSARSLLSMYALSRQGRIRFDPLPFYREQRVTKRSLPVRAPAAAPSEPGDEAMRLGLENLMSQALRDSGANRLPSEQVTNARNLIDNLLHARAIADIQRALGRGDFIAAVELKRRLALWRGLASAEEIERDVWNLVLPAAAIAVANTYESLSQAQAISLRGFGNPWLANFLSRWRPDIPIITDRSLGGEDVLIVHRDFDGQAADPDPDAAGAVVFQQVASLYRIASDVIDVAVI